MTSSEIQAYILGALSALFNGSFAACAKLTSTPVDPILFTFYNSIGVLLSSFLVTILLPVLNQLPETSIYYAGSDHLTFSYLGIIAGSLYIVSIVFSFAAVQFIGLGVGQGIWGGSAILVSFLWGVLVLGDSVFYVSFAVLSLLTLMCGIAGIAMNDVLADVLFCRKDLSKCRGEKEQLIGEGDLEAAPSVSPEKSSFALGVICALSVGVFGGSVLVPMSFVSEDLAGLAFLPSFGIGSFLAASIIAAVYYGAIIKSNPLETFTISGFLYGILSGIIWNTGNAFSIFGINGIGYATAYPIMQCSLFFGGLWGIFVFKEVTDTKDITAFFLSAIVLFVGAILLSVNTSV